MHDFKNFNSSGELNTLPFLLPYQFLYFMIRPQGKEEMIHPSKNFIKMKWFLGKENIWKACEQYNLGDKLRITCVEGYLENQNTFIEGYLTDIDIGDYYNAAEICISSTLNEPIDGEYTWLAVDAVTDIEILERRKLSWEKKE